MGGTLDLPDASQLSGSADGGTLDLPGSADGGTMDLPASEVGQSQTHGPVVRGGPGSMEKNTRTSSATRSWANWAAAAWASSTRPGRRAEARGGAEDDPRRRTRQQHRGDPLSAPRPRPSPACSTRTSCRCTRSASTTACPIFSLEFVEGGSLADRLAEPKSLPFARRPGWCRRWPTAIGLRHGPASSTATSSRPTSCWPRDGTPKITDFGLAKKLEDDSTATRSRRDHGHAQLHGPRAGRGHATTTSARPPTSTPWVRSSTKC